MSRNPTPTIKIHRIASVEEALAFEALGADIVGVALAPEHGGALFDDNRTLSVPEVERVGAALSRARLSVALADPVGRDPNPVLELAQRCSAAYLQTPTFDLPNADMRAALAGAGVGLVVSRIQASHDDDPAWLLPPAEELGNSEIAFFEIELLADHDRAWRFMTDEAPGYPDELQLADIDSLAQEQPLLISVDITPENVVNILATLPCCRGLTLNLGHLSPERYDVHVYSPEHASAVMAAVRGSSSG